MSHRRFHAIESELIRCRREMSVLLESNAGQVVEKELLTLEQKSLLKDLVWFESGVVPENVRTMVLKRQLLKSAGGYVYIGTPPAISAGLEYREWFQWVNGLAIDESSIFHFFLNALFRWRAFVEWYNELDASLSIEPRNGKSGGIMIQSVDFFPNKGIGFVKFKASFLKDDARNAGRKLKIPGIVFMRGAAVALLPVITVGDNPEPYTLLTFQARVPIGKAAFPEIPAGMMDGDNNFVGIAAKELKEETGLSPDPTELVDLTHHIYGGRFHGMYPSPGGSDEYLRIFLWDKKLTQSEYEELNEKVRGVHGEAEEGEEIKVRMIKLKDLHTSTPDAKALSALTLYNAYKAMK